MVGVNGIAHIQLTVRDPERCLSFWERLCNFLDMRTLIRGEDVLHCIGHSVVGWSFAINSRFAWPST